MIISKHIKKPIVTEKSVSAATAGKYIFKVGMTANKHQIRLAVEKLFDVEVLKINSMVIPGKKRRIRGSRQFTKTPMWKKVVVQLKAGQKIDIGATE